MINVHKCNGLLCLGKATQHTAQLKGSFFNHSRSKMIWINLYLKEINLWIPRKNREDEKVATHSYTFFSIRYISPRVNIGTEISTSLTITHLDMLVDSSNWNYLPRSTLTLELWDMRVTGGSEQICINSYRKNILIFRLANPCVSFICHDQSWLSQTGENGHSATCHLYAAIFLFPQSCELLEAHF